MDNIPENTNHINYRKNEIIHNIANGFVKSQDEDAHEEESQEEEKTEGALTSEQKQLIKQYIVSHPHLDDEDFHKYAMKMGINKHEAEEAVYQMFNEVYNQDRLKELEGGKADNMTADDIAKKHNITLQELQKQINIGLKVEREHTKNEKQALEITLDHLCENAKYYTEAKPENWAEKEIEKEKAIIGELDMLNKALPPTEGEVREYKDGKYRFEGGHWKKIKQEEKHHNKNEKQTEELEWKKNVEGDYEAYEGNNSFYIYHPDSYYYLKINDKHRIKGTLEICKAGARSFLKEEKIKKQHSTSTSTTKEESNATAAYDWLKKHNMTATSYELNQAAESTIKSGILTPKERELVKKKFEKEKPKVEEKNEESDYTIFYHVPYQKRTEEGGYETEEETFTDKKAAINFASKNYSSVEYVVEDKEGEEVENGYINLDKGSNSYGNLFVGNAVNSPKSTYNEEKPKVEEKPKETNWKDIEMPSGFKLSMNSMYGSGTQIPYIYKEGDDDNYVMIGPDWENGGEIGVFWSILNKEGNTIKKLVKGKEEAIKEAIKSLSSSTKPVAKVIGEDGNVFNLIGICMRVLKRVGQPEKAKEMQGRIFKAGSYDEALAIMGEYCDLQ